MQVAFAYGGCAQIEIATLFVATQAGFTWAIGRFDAKISRKALSTTTPTLYVFNISHYCEKARWALDYFGMDYKARHVMPGAHRLIAKKLGAKRGSVPFLQTNDGVIAGSPAIIDWCEAHNTSQRPSLSGAQPEIVRVTEKRLDAVVGVHVRRFYYSDALFSNPAAVRPIFSDGLPIL